MYLIKQAGYFIQFLKDLVQSRSVVFELTKQDFRAQYLGSYLGLVWAFINPAVTILVLWFVFQLGFKSKPVDSGFPFVLWLMAGLIPWFFFAESVSRATRSVIEKSFLVKKVVFRVSILPIIKILSALMIHVFFVAVFLVLFLFYGYVLPLSSIQVFYYVFCMFVFILGLTWLTSALAIFIKDVEHIISMVLQFGFWITPIFWNLKMLPEQLQYLIMLNPMFYIVQGYRDSFIGNTWFWEYPGLTVYFWSLTSLQLIGGALLFRKLRPHFSDVL